MYKFAHNWGDEKHSNEIEQVIGLVYPGQILPTWT